MAHAEKGAQVADVGLSYDAGGSSDTVKGSSADDQRDMARMGKQQEVRAWGMEAALEYCTPTSRHGSDL
ncbi:hypothetical protein LTR56_016392 [Elasticomyces elasticus]|nr:hypothetical protein LTR56_016392 [Elasticomyces elasticus]KAK3636269.1 hypothetical protein LTR22_018789 [Elasticomyces elasticus]